MASVGRLVRRAAVPPRRAYLLFFLQSPEINYRSGLITRLRWRMPRHRGCRPDRQ